MDLEVRTLRPAGPALGSAREGGRARPSRAEPVFLVALLVGMVTAVVVRGGPPAYPGSTLLILSLASWLPLLVRSRWPLVVLASTVVVEILHLVVVPFTGTSPTAGAAMGAYQPVPIATMVAAYTMAGRRSGWRAWVPGGVAAVALFVVSLIAQPLHLIGTDVVLLELVVIATGVGVLVTGRRERSQRLERERLEATRREVIAERLRIARDLHDVLAHHLAVVNAQAGVAEYLMRTDPQTASTALHDIALNTRKALDELRATVGLLRQDDEPAPPGDDDPRHPLPGLDRLEELLAGFRSAGATVALTVTGSPRALAPGGDLAAYRIVQEALTNATKHAPGAPVDVTLHWLRRRLDLRIANGPGPGLPHDHRGPGTGHGLIGMRERALTCGGTLTAEPSPAGGFAVNATIPEYDDPDTPADSATTPASPPEVTP